MPYLLQLSDSGQTRHVPVAEPTAVALERALLTIDAAERQRILAIALESDPELAEWATHEASPPNGTFVDSAGEAALWLADRLATKLAGRLVELPASESPAKRLAGNEPTIAWRLPALVAILCEYERRLADFDQRLEQEKLDSLKELAYGASHEINNPLANIAARAQTLLRDEADAGRQRKLAAIHRQAMRAHEMISDLMLFARPPKLEVAACDLRHVTQQVVAEMAELARERQIELNCELTDDPVVFDVDATQLAVAIGALVTNSLEAVSQGGHVDVAVRRQSSDGHAWAEVVVEDDGPGISDEVRRHMFDPFYSGREAGRGLGFGLSKCWRIVTDHGGQVIVGQSARRGAQISILLPLAVKSPHV
jgi:signal transduction histidine kinase